MPQKPGIDVASSRRMVHLESLHVVNGLRAIELGGQRQACHSNALRIAQLIHLQPKQEQVECDSTSLMTCTAASFCAVHDYVRTDLGVLA